MGGFLGPVTDVLNQAAQRQNALTGIGMQEQGLGQRQQAQLAQERAQLVLQNHLAKRQHLEQQINNAIPNMFSSASKAALSGLASELAALKDPELGKTPPDIDQYSQRFYDILRHDTMGQQHDQAVANNTAAAAMPKPTGPGVMPPGQTPGQTPMAAPAVPSIDQFTGGAIQPVDPTAAALSFPPAASQVGTSPVQPSRQQGGGATQTAPTSFPAIPEPPATANIPSVAGAAAPVPVSAGAAAPGPVMPVSPADHVEQEVADLQNQLTAGPMEPWRQQALYNRLVPLQQLHNMMTSGVWDKLDPFTQNLWYGQAHGFTMPPMAFGQPEQISVDADRLTAEQKSAYGIPPNATGNWTTLRGRTGYILGSVPRGTTPITAVDNAGNEYLVNRFGAGAQPINLSQPPGTPAPPAAGPAISAVAPTAIPKTATSVTDVYGNVVHKTAPTLGSPTAANAGGNAAALGSKANAVARTPGTAFLAPTQHLPRGANPLNPSAPGQAGVIDQAVVQLMRGVPTGDLRLNTKAAALVNQRMGELGLDINNLTGSMRDQAARASAALQEYPNVVALINQADADGDMGVFMKHWNDFLSGKIGADPTKNHIFSKLASNMNFFTSAVEMAHGGLRAASSPGVMSHWDEALSATTKDTLLAKLGQAANWLQDYKRWVPSGAEVIQGVNQGAAKTGGIANDPLGVR